MQLFTTVLFHMGCEPSQPFVKSLELDSLLSRASRTWIELQVKEEMRKLAYTSISVSSRDFGC